MSTFTVLYAVHVPHYGQVEIEARTPARAIALAKTCDPAEICIERDWTSAVCARIVSITEDSGRSIAEDVALDGAFLRYGGRPAWLLCENAAAMLDSLKNMVVRADELLGSLASTNHYDALVERRCDATNSAETVIAKAAGQE
jgi:hypothetical protein